MGSLCVNEKNGETAKDDSELTLASISIVGVFDEIFFCSTLSMCDDLCSTRFVSTLRLMMCHTLNLSGLGDQTDGHLHKRVTSAKIGRIGVGGSVF